MAAELAARPAELRYGSRPQHVTRRQLKRAEAIIVAADGNLDLAGAAVEIAVREGRNDPKGFPKHLGGVLEGGYLERARASHDDDERHRQMQDDQRREDARKNRYEVWCEERASARMSALSPEERHRLVDHRLPEFIHRYRFYLQQQSWTEERVREWAAPRILMEYGREGEPRYAEWCAHHDVEISARASGPERHPTVTPTP